MLFNSFEFAVFFPLVFLLYWSLSRWLTGQNILLLVASYVFYGFWDWRFLTLILISTVVDFWVGRSLHRAHDAGNSQRAKHLVIVSIAVNLGILGVFKYFNFFVDSFAVLLSSFGLSVNVPTLGIILPVGISFYTFQTLSYTVDIYRKKLRPTNNFLAFAVFVAFFPQLVAGPIERAKNLLPQLTKTRSINWDDLYAGISLIIIGLFKKVFVADSLSVHVDTLFSAESLSSLDVLMAGWLFAFQIYADFSGYSDIARGTARLLGINLRLNFNFPYLSRNPQEFWRRWHISLSSWLRDYLYISLGGNRKGSAKTYRNLGLTMLLGGLWHGAAWNFVIWGAYQGLLLMAHRYMIARFTLPKFEGSATWSWLRVAVFFQFVCLGWLFFRAESLSQIGTMFIAIANLEFGSSLVSPYTIAKYILPLLLFEIAHNFVQSRDWISLSVKRLIHSSALAVLFYLFAFFGGAAQGFIYFQF